MNNMIRFPDSDIDFINDVGVTGMDHDNYAEVGSKPRNDWIKMILLGLLANQASMYAPINHRVGSLWFNLELMSYKCSDGNDFKCLSDAIAINGQTLSEWASNIDDNISSINITGTFSGIAHHDFNVINIPRQLQAISKPPNMPKMFKNGKIVPSGVSFNKHGTVVCIELSGDAVLEDGDEFVVIIS